LVESLFPFSLFFLQAERTKKKPESPEIC
jgi:hypothetical protein